MSVNEKIENKTGIPNSSSNCNSKTLGSIEEVIENRLQSDLCRRLTFPSESCINCEQVFNSSRDQITDLKVGYCSEDDDTETSMGEEPSSISIVEALYSVFSIDAKEIEAIDLSKVGFCLKCAQVVSELYRHYIDLLNLSKPTSTISQSVQQFRHWHLQNPISDPEVMESNERSFLSFQDVIPKFNGLSKEDEVVDVEKVESTEPLDTEVIVIESKSEPDHAINGLDNQGNGSSEKISPKIFEETGLVNTEEKLLIAKPNLKVKSDRVQSVIIRKSTRERKVKQRFDPDEAELDVPKLKTSGVTKIINHSKSNTKKIKHEPKVSPMQPPPVPKKSVKSKKRIVTEKMTQSKTKLKILPERQTRNLNVRTQSARRTTSIPSTRK